MRMQEAEQVMKNAADIGSVGTVGAGVVSGIFNFESPFFLVPAVLLSLAWLAYRVYDIHLLTRIKREQLRQEKEK